MYGTKAALVAILAAMLLLAMCCGCRAAEKNTYTYHIIHWGADNKTIIEEFWIQKGYVDCGNGRVSIVYSDHTITLYGQLSVHKTLDKPLEGDSLPKTYRQ
jgi:hypothetical protein